MLEKILLEIEEESYSTNTDYGYSVVANMDSIVRIIRSHMDEAGLIAACCCKDCTHKEWRGNSGRVYCPKTHSWRDADDFCKFAEKGNGEYDL